MLNYLYFFAPNTKYTLVVGLLEKKKNTIQYGYRKLELMHECFPKHSRMGTARMKYDKETEESKKSGVSMQSSKKKEVPTDYQYLIKIQK